MGHGVGVWIRCFGNSRIERGGVLISADPCLNLTASAALHQVVRTPFGPLDGSHRHWYGRPPSQKD